MTGSPIAGAPAVSTDQQAGRLLKFYEQALQGYTYLEDSAAD